MTSNNATYSIEASVTRVQYKKWSFDTKFSGHVTGDNLLALKTVSIVATVVLRVPSSELMNSLFLEVCHGYLIQIAPRNKTEFSGPDEYTGQSLT